MYLSSVIVGLIGAFSLCPMSVRADNGAFLIVNEPSAGSQMVNGAVNPVRWTKGLLDKVPYFDLELSRISDDGLILVAMQVPAKPSEINLYLEDVPSGDDYFLIFTNSTRGKMYGLSQRFSILSAGETPSTTATPAASAPTVTVSGGPNPTAQFATVFPASGALGGWRTRAGAEWHYRVASLTSAAVAIGLSAAWTLL